MRLDDPPSAERMEAIAPSTEALFIMSSVVIPWLAQLQRDIQSDVTRRRGARTVSESVGTRQANVQGTVVMAVRGGITVNCAI